MRETVYISDGFRMCAGTLCPLNALKTKICFWVFSNILLLLFLGALGSMVPWCHSGAMETYQQEDNYEKSEYDEDQSRDHSQAKLEHDRDVPL